MKYISASSVVIFGDVRQQQQQEPLLLGDQVTYNMQCANIAAACILSYWIQSCKTLYFVLKISEVVDVLTVVSNMEGG